MPTGPLKAIVLTTVMYYYFDWKPSEDKEQTNKILTINISTLCTFTP